MCDKALRRYLGFCSFVGLRYRGYQEQTGITGTPNTIQQTMEVFISFKMFLLHYKTDFSSKKSLHFSKSRKLARKSVHAAEQTLESMLCVCRFISLYQQK